MIRTINTDGSWNWDALEQHFAGQLSPEDVKSLFTNDPPEPEPQKMVEMYPTLTDEQLVEWLLTVELRERPETAHDLYIVWRLMKIEDKAPILYHRFLTGVRNLR